MAAATCRCHHSWTSLISTGFDTCTSLVSVLDVISDLMVMMYFYERDRMGFFNVSLSIIIATHLTYCLALILTSDQHSTRCNICIFVASLPFAPVLPFLFYFTSDSNTCMHSFIVSILGKFNVVLSTADHTNNNEETMDAFRTWSENKWHKHLGFLIEAVIEAFPQSILQLIYMVHYDEVTPILIFSIVVSITSVAIKSFIFSVTRSINWKTAVFNWMCFMSDFLSILCTFSFLFYIPSSIDPAPFEIIRKIWFYKGICTTLPFALIASIVLNIEWSYRLHSLSIVLLLIRFIINQLAWAICLCFTIIIMETMCCLLLAIIITQTGFAERINSSRATQHLFMDILKFIKSNRSVQMDHSDEDNDHEQILITEAQDQVIRICCVNDVLCKSADGHASLKQYLIQHSTKDGNRRFPFSDVELDHIIMMSAGPNDIAQYSVKRVIKMMIEELDALIYAMSPDDSVCDCSSLLIYVLLPLYCVGRVCTLLYPFFIVSYVLIWTGTIPGLHAALFALYASLVILFVISFVNVLPEQKLASYILPARNQLNLWPECDLKRYLETHATTGPIDRYYAQIVTYPVTEHLLCKKFGNDIAFIIMMYFRTSNTTFRYNILRLDRDRRAIKVLLLGAGNTGKTTLFKQFRLAFGDGYDDSKLMQFKGDIFRQVIDDMRQLIYLQDVAMYETDEKTNDAQSLRISANARRAASVIQDTTNAEMLTPAVVNAIECLWREQSLKSILNSKTTAALSDSCAYFWDNIRTISRRDYVPSKEEVLLSYSKTTGIVEQQFSIDTQLLKVIDTGGQRAERKKWIHCFGNVTVVLFVVSLCHYNEYLMEDESKNAMEDSIELFSEIVNCRWFRNTSFVLILNKMDLFEEKIQSVPITECSCAVLHSFEGDPTDFDEVTAFIKNIFEDCNRDDDKQILTRLCCAVDETCVQRIFDEITPLVITDSLQRAGLM
eukprot:371455_1